VTLGVRGPAVRRLAVAGAPLPGTLSVTRQLACLGASVGAVALSHRAILTPQIFRHDTEDGRQDSHQSRFTADNRITFVPIF
jgi:hypothetical protein